MQSDSDQSTEEFFATMERRINLRNATCTQAERDAERQFQIEFGIESASEITDEMRKEAELKAIKLREKYER
jgi:hypothetical protein